MKNAILNVDLDSIIYNYRHLKCYYKKNVIAVLKDDAYGVGLIQVAKALENEENIIIAINHLNEAKTLRENNYSKDILYLNVFDENDIDFIKENNISVVVESLTQLKLMKKQSINFHLKFNTGMNRLGLDKTDALIAIKEVNQNNKLYHLSGLMTHFANKDEDHKCYKLFENYVKLVKKENLIIHCFASSSLDEYFDNVTTHIRVGIKLYGIGEKNSFLHNALTLISPILSIKKIKKDEKVGYDLDYIVPYDGYIYLLPIGYGQGFGRFNKSLAFLKYNYLKQAGKISMDYSTYFSKQKYGINDVIELFGKNIPIDSLCFVNNIDPHELLVRLKVNKQYHKTTIKE